MQNVQTLNKFRSQKQARRHASAKAAATEQKQRSEDYKNPFVRLPSGILCVWQSKCIFIGLLLQSNVRLLAYLVRGAV